MSAAAANSIPASMAGHRPQELVRVYVWEWPVRFAHWVVAYSLAVLAATGFYIGHPFVTVHGRAGDHFFMGTVKVVHAYAATAFTLAVVIRIAWMFLGNRYSHWDKFIPVTRKRFRGMLLTFRFYAFQLRQPPGFVGHNPLAGATYILVFALYLLMITSGLGLRGASADVESPFRAFAPLLSLYGGAQSARWFHHVGMWLLLGFAVHHVYSAVLMSQVEARGTVESMASGYKFVPAEDLVYSGYRYLDHQDLEPGEEPAVTPKKAVTGEAG